MSNIATWRIRHEGARGDGQEIDFARLTHGVADGVWTEGDEVRGPLDNRWLPVGDHPDLEEFVPEQPLFRVKPSEDVDMDMTPMIDVTFQLMIFFMITATFVVQKTLDMPTADPQRQAARRPTLTQIRENNIIVKVSRDGRITVDGQPAGLDKLEDALRQAGKGRSNFELAMDVDDEVDQKTVVGVIDAAAGVQIQKVHFLRRAPP